MSDDADMAEEQLPLEGAGQKLARTREAKGMSVADIAAETRIPQRHLEVIEAGDWSALPARTYAIGFSRTYARAVGLNEGEIADQVRAELAHATDDEPHRPTRFEPSDPARVPSRGLAWFSAFAVILLIAGGLAFFRGYFFPGSGPGSIVEPVAVAENAEVAGEGSEPSIQTASTNPTGAVVFTSLEDGVWVKFYDGAGERLMEKQMAKGERYTVPAGVQGPQVWTGQPEALSITIGGQQIGNLSLESEIVRDIPVTAEALVSRVAENAAAATRQAQEEAAVGPANNG